MAEKGQEEGGKGAEMVQKGVQNKCNCMKNAIYMKI